MSVFQLSIVNTNASLPSALPTTLTSEGDTAAIGMYKWELGS